MNFLIHLLNVNRISFPGLWDGEITVDETAFTIPGLGLTVAWYGIIITIGIVVAVWYIQYRGKRSGLLFDDLLDVTIFTVIPGIIGARLYYVFFDWLKNPGNYNRFYDIINIRGGGLAIYGGIIFGAIACILALRYKKIRIPAFFDCLAPAVMIAQSIGRWGNFCNGEAYGRLTSLPWAMRIDTALTADGTWWTQTTGAHPTFLYESLWNLIGFILLFLFFKRRKFDGQITLSYLTWYGFGRMFIEGLRTDSLYIGGSGIRVSQLLAFACFIIAGAALVGLTFFKYKEKSVADCIYLPGAKALTKSASGKNGKQEYAVEETSEDSEASQTIDHTESGEPTEESESTETSDADSSDENESEDN